jgi:predicted PurR-regulated permease PerM
VDIEKAWKYAVIVIAFVALAAALRAGSSVAAPLTFGLVLGVVLSPLSDFVDRIGVPRVFSALLSIVVAVVLITGIVLFAEPKVTYAVQRTPQIMSELGSILEGLQGIIRGIDDVSETVSEAINDGETGAPAEEPEKEPVRVPGGFEALSLAPSFAAQLLIVIGAFFFFLISRHEIYEWAARRRDGGTEGNTARTLKEAERLVARYFLTVSVINATLGLLVGVAFYALGMPAPYVWGFVAAALNYFLYIGPAVFAVASLLGGLLAFDGAAAMLPAIVYICMNAVEGNFVTPTFIGRNMQVNPLMIFLSLVFWLWMWGPLGGIVAIPLLLYGLAVVSGFGVSEPIWRRPRMSAAVGDGPSVSGPRPDG